MLQRAALARIAFVLQVSCRVIFMVLKERKEVTKLRKIEARSLLSDEDGVL